MIVLAIRQLVRLPNDGGLGLVRHNFVETCFNLTKHLVSIRYFLATRYSFHCMSHYCYHSDPFLFPYMFAC